MSTMSPAFDRDEYLHLAIEAAGRGDHGAALAYLKEGGQKFPEDARIAYLLGAEHAQIGLYDRAEVEMSRAVQLDPTLHTACFQLGLLQMTQGKPDAAQITWEGLDALPPQHALRHFRDGLLALAADRFTEAREKLQSGLALNDFSPDLNGDMERLMEKIPDQTPAVGEGEGEPEGHLWLNPYQNSGSLN